MEEFSKWTEEDSSDESLSVSNPVSVFDLCEQKNVLTLSGEFLLIPFQSSDPDLCKEGLKISNDGKNRYGNVVPADETRVKIESPRGDYINANFVELNPEESWKMIACQAPTKKTVEDFWLMVFQHEVEVVLMTTKLFEGEKQKSTKYWPALGKITKAGNIELQTLEIEVVTSKIIISKIKITQKFNDEKFATEASHVVVHIYYTGWPDFGVPEESEVSQILNILDKNWKNRKLPFVCHCSAGIGRTGTIASILRFFFTKNESVREVVTKIRKQRHGMVQTADQFKFIFRYIDYCKKISLSEECPLLL